MPGTNSKVKEYDEHDLEVATWRGSVTATIEAMNQEMKDSRHERQRMNNRLTKLQVKTGSISGLISLIVAVVVSSLKGNIIGR